MGSPNRVATRWALRLGAAVLAVLACAPALRAQPAKGEPPALLLDAARPAFDIPRRWAWVGPEAEAGIQRAATGQLSWRLSDAATVFPLARGQALWLKLRLQPQGIVADHWVLQIPLPVLDSATLFQQDASGAWTARTTGDLVSADAGRQPGRFPAFRLQLRDGQPQELYLQVRHSIALNLPLRLVTAAEHDHRMRLEYLGLGMAFGALALLVTLSVARAWRLRDRGYGLYAAYALLSMLAVAAFTGIAGHMVWGASTGWTDAAPGCLALLAGAIAVWIVGGLTEVASRTRWLGKALHASGWAGPALALLYLLVDRRIGVLLAGAYLLLVAALSLAAALFTWRRGDPVGRWIAMGSAPLVLAVMVSLARVFGWLEASWLTESALVLALAFDLPMLLGALNSRSRERRGAQLRQLAAASQDPLTGLLKTHPFQARLAQATQRLQRRGEGAAVAVIELANHGWLKSSRGPEAAEECLLRAVIKLRRLVRDVDTTGRLGEARFGLILEGVSSRATVSEIASRLIVSGLIAEAEQPRDPELKFHVVAVLLAEHCPPDEELMRALLGGLDRMSPRTRRPFRFLEPRQGLPGQDSGSGLQPSEPAPFTASA